MVDEQVNKMSESDTEDCCLLLDCYQQESPLVYVPRLWCQIRKLLYIKVIFLIF